MVAVIGFVFSAEAQVAGMNPVFHFDGERVFARVTSIEGNVVHFTITNPTRRDICVSFSIRYTDNNGNTVYRRSRVWIRANSSQDSWHRDLDNLTFRGMAITNVSAGSC